MTTQHALELRDVTAGYGSTTVLKDVSVQVPSGSVVALLGPNGAGKTTALRAASGLLPARSGGVFINGSDVTRARPARRARAGLCLIPEGRGVFPELSVAENLRLLLPPWGARAAVDGVLDVFPALRDRLGQRAGTMSGGQQQMLALARAWMSTPRVVLLDEVSMGLAPLVVEEIFQALEALRVTGTSIFWSSSTSTGRSSSPTTCTCSTAVVSRSPAGPTNSIGTRSCESYFGLQGHTTD